MWVAVFHQSIVIVRSPMVSLLIMSKPQKVRNRLVSVGQVSYLHRLEAVEKPGEHTSPAYIGESSALEVLTAHESRIAREWSPCSSGDRSDPPGSLTA